MTIVFQKSLLKSKGAKRIVADAKLTYFKEKLLEHLDALEKKEKRKAQAVQKALLWEETVRKAAYPVGTVREWKGKKYMKVAPGKWRRKYDSEGRGTRLSLAAIKRKVDKCETVEELLQVAKQNKHRFTDENGRYLPVVREMFDYVSKKHKEIKGKNGAGQAASGSVGSGASSGGSVGSGGNAVKQKKKDILGNVSKDSLKKKGISDKAARRIMDIYNAVGDAPLQDTPEARRAYAKGISALRDKLEGAKTEYDVEDAKRDLTRVLLNPPYLMELYGTEEYKKRAGAAQDARKEADKAKNRVKRIKSQLRSEKGNGAFKRSQKVYGEYYLKRGVISREDRMKYLASLSEKEREEHDRYFNSVYAKAMKESLEAAEKLEEKLKAAYDTCDEELEKAKKAEKEFKDWEDSRIDEMTRADGDSLYAGLVQLGKKFRENLEPRPIDYDESEYVPF